MSDHDSDSLKRRTPQQEEVSATDTASIDVPASLLNALFSGMITLHKETSASLSVFDQKHNNLLWETASGNIHCINIKWGQVQNDKFAAAVMGGPETFIPYYFTLAMQNIMVIAFSESHKIKLSLIHI